VPGLPSPRPVIAGARPAHDGPGRRRGRVACALALALALMAPADARADWRAERFAAALAQAERARGLEAHLALAEALRVAASVDDPTPLRPVAARLAARSAVPWLQGEALGALAFASRADSVAEARSLAQAAGVIAEGWVLGPLPGHGAGEAPPPIDGEHEARGSRGPTSWRAFAEATLIGGLQLGDLLGSPAGDVHGFVAVALEAQRPLDVMVVVGSNGPLGVWLNGEQRLEWDGERPLSDWQHALPLRLERGVHHLVLRAGHAAELPEVSVRVIDGRGRRPAGLTARAPRAGDALAGVGEARGLPAAILDMATGDDRLAGHVGLFVTPEAATQRRAARALARWLQRHPDDAEAWYLLGRAERADRSRAAEAFERAWTRSGGRHAGALGELIELHEAQGLVAHADAFARQLAAIDPRHPTALGHRLARLATLADAAAALPQAAGDPRVDRHGRLAALVATLRESAGQVPEAARAWAALGRLANGMSFPVQQAVTLARRAGDLALAGEVVDDALARRPYAVDLALLRARTLATHEEGVPAAIASLEDALAFHPDSPELHELRGRLALLAGDRAGALAAFDRALELRPQHRALADYRRHLVAERDMDERWAVPLDEVLAAAPSAPAREGARVLLERHAVEVFDSGLASHYRQVVVRLDDERARDRLQQMVFGFTPGEDRMEVLAAEVYRPDGSPDGSRLRPRAIFDHRPEGKQMGVYSLRAMKVVAFEELREGDVVHVRIRRDEIGARNLFGDFFGVFLPLQSELPKSRVEVFVDAPLSRPLYAHGERVGVDAIQRVDEAAGRQELAWRLDALPAIAGEPRMPGYGDVGAYVSVSTFASWRELAAWYRELIRHQLTLSAELEATARALVEGLDDVRDKVAAIQAWVVQSTRYVAIAFGIHGFKPYRVTDVVTRGYGDCKDKTALLMAMLDAVGVASDFVLVRTRDLGRLHPEPPTLWAFNHAIAYVPAIDRFIDGTSELAGLGELPALDQGAMALRVDVLRGEAYHEPEVIPMQSPEDNRVTSDGRLAIDASGDARARFRETIAGTLAPVLRMNLQDASQRDERVGVILARQHPGAVVEGARYEHLADLGVPVVVEVDVRLPALARVTGDGGLEVPLALDPRGRLERYGAMAVRALPLVVEHLEREEERTEFTLPEGYEVARAPAPVLLETPFGRFEQRVTPGEGGFVLESTFTLEVAEVAPAQYPAFRAYLEAVAQARGQRVLVRPR